MPRAEVGCGRSGRRFEANHATTNVELLGQPAQQPPNPTVQAMVHSCRSCKHQDAVAVNGIDALFLAELDRGRRLGSLLHPDAANARLDGIQYYPLRLAGRDDDHHSIRRFR